MKKRTVEKKICELTYEQIRKICEEHHGYDIYNTCGYCPLKVNSTTCAKWLIDRKNFILKEIQELESIQILLNEFTQKKVNIDE